MRDLRPALQPCWEQRPRGEEEAQGRCGRRGEEAEAETEGLAIPLSILLPCFAFCPPAAFESRSGGRRARSSVEHKAKPRQGALASILASRSTPQHPRPKRDCVQCRGREDYSPFVEGHRDLGGRGGGATPSRGAGNGMRRPKQVKFALAPDVGQARNPPRGLLGRVRAGSGSAPSHEGRKTSPWFLGVKAQAVA